MKKVINAHKFSTNSTFYTAFSNTCWFLLYQITKDESFLKFGFKNKKNSRQVRFLASVPTFIFRWVILIQLNKQVTETRSYHPIAVSIGVAVPVDKIFMGRTTQECWKFPPIYNVVLNLWKTYLLSRPATESFRL